MLNFPWILKVNTLIVSLNLVNIIKFLTGTAHFPLQIVFQEQYPEYAKFAEPAGHVRWILKNVRRRGLISLDKMSGIVKNVAVKSPARSQNVRRRTGDSPDILSGEAKSNFV